VNTSAVFLPQFFRYLFLDEFTFTIDSSTPTLTASLNEHPILVSTVTATEFRQLFYYQFEKSCIV
jgi:hypothetical protein